MRDEGPHPIVLVDEDEEIAPHIGERVRIERDRSNNARLVLDPNGNYEVHSHRNAGIDQAPRAIFVQLRKFGPRSPIPVIS